jgi:hypothetical protein
MNDNDRKDLARVLLRAASQALECATPEDFSGLKQTTDHELQRVWARTSVDSKGAARLARWMRTLSDETVATDYGATCANYAGKLLQLMGERR